MCAKSMAVGVGLALCVVLLAAHSDAYTLKPVSLHSVGRPTAGGRLWRPDRAISLGPLTAAVRLSTSEYHCESGKGCEYVTAWTADDGTTWHVERGFGDFCGTAGVLLDGVLRCPSNQIRDDGIPDLLTFAQHGYRISPSGLIARASMSRSELPFQATFNTPPTEAANPPLDILQFGDQVANFEDMGLYFRNVNLLLANGTEAHALYKSTDGASWSFVSFIPFPIGKESALLRWGDTKLFVIAGEPGNYTQAESVYLGLHWEKVQPSKFSTLMYSYVSPYFTSIYTGLRGLPGLFAAAQGSKKGSEKPINIADFHNRLVKKASEGVAPPHATNYSQPFLNANVTEFKCHQKPHTTDPEEGCESSSDAAVVSTQNGTVLLIYDKVHGFGPTGSQADQGEGVYAMKMSLNETKEAKEQEERIEKERKKKAQDQAYEEARKKAEQEATERRKKERREKRRKDKERRAQYAAIDAVNIERAQKEAAKDGEIVVIREVDPAWVDLERDTY